ncbi:hypothetical protein D3C87_1256010 [compost metagenome]
MTFSTTEALLDHPGFVGAHEVVHEILLISRRNLLQGGEHAMDERRRPTGIDHDFLVLGVLLQELDRVLRADKPLCFS